MKTAIKLALSQNAGEKMVMLYNKQVQEKACPLYTKDFARRIAQKRNANGAVLVLNTRGHYRDVLQ